ncbi:Rik1-associated factor [Lachnellula suecica]|uniref:Rik1-associated factor n=1 Tax=Lachnellula suecica TaxID=602035 RepID=A0A8T9CH71_9HELO|nr:Rik1-associated factor [Lachnellula suecica]
MEAHALPRGKQEFIDLTLSDDEDESHVHMPASDQFTSAAQKIKDLPPSNHGLMTIDSNNENWSRNEHRSYGYGYGYASVMPPGGPNTNAIPATQLRPSSRAPAPQSQNPPIPHTTGHRRYEEDDLETLAAGPYSANEGPSKPPGRFIQYTPSDLNHSKQHTASTRRRGAMGSANRGGAVGVNAPPANDVVGGNQRSSGNAGKTASEDAPLPNEKIQHMLKKQMFPHIISAVNQYKGKLSTQHRNAIGEMTAGTLVRDPSFLENYMANEHQLSSEYEKGLAIKAKSTVDQCAEEYLKPRTSSGNLSGPAKPSARSGIESRRFTTRVISNSSASGDGAEIFEEHPAMQPASRHSTRSRTYSSSPTTSYSQDALDLGNLSNSDMMEDVRPFNTESPNPTRQFSTLERSNSRPVVLLRSATPVQITEPRRPQKSEPPDIKSSSNISVTYAGMPASRPYASFANRNRLPTRGACPHVDFSLEEIEVVSTVIKSVTGRSIPYGSGAASITSLMDGQRQIIPKVLDALQQRLKAPGPGMGRQLLRGRKSSALESFLRDAANGKLTENQRLQLTRTTAQPRSRPSILSQLRDRETIGLASLDFRQGQGSFKEKAMCSLEDSLVRISEWTDCCGDVATVSWAGEKAFVCGAVAHSDHFNMQYNKPGNLGVGSVSLDTLTAISDHRIVRPLVGTAENAENALESMRQTQDPWLYTSVVSTSHNEINGYTFTASFDKTVKVWTVSEDGSSMDLRGTWDHENNVNFVVTSEHHDRVATAADVCNDAIRVYNFDELDVSNSPYDTYSGGRAREQAQEVFRRDKWAYFPATIQWGKAASVSRLLLVGYSPRSTSGQDTDIPEDKKNTGELCIWDVEDMEKIPITSAHMQNVFEVIWHPSQPFFVAATSPSGHFESDTRTQIRLYARKGLGPFFHLTTMDCPALDINELTIMPNSDLESWVTASCTDGNTYVWDTASHTEPPIHVLNHGESLDNPLPELPREIGDEGVKFACWGQSSHRFYTGASDGKVTAWNIHEKPGKAFVRYLLELSGGVTSGAFSKDFSKLLIGDATGKVHFLGYDDSDLEEETQESSTPTPSIRPGSGILQTALTKRPKVIIPHPEPPHPLHFEGDFLIATVEPSGRELAMEFLHEGRLRLHPDPGIGAVQGPNYAETNLFRLEAHEESDASKPLLPGFEAVQHYGVQHKTTKTVIPQLPPATCSDSTLHSRNVAWDLALERDGIDLDWEYRFPKEVTPCFAIFGHKKRRET